MTNNNSHASGLVAGKSFFKGNVLQDWEKAAVSSYAATMNIRNFLETILVFLALNFGCRIFLLRNHSLPAQNAMMGDLGGYVIFGIFVVLTYYMPKWWMVLATVIVGISFALGLLTVTIAFIFLFLFPALKRTQRCFYISGTDCTEMNILFMDIASGKMADAWPEIGRRGKISFHARFFENAVVFVSRQDYPNIVTLAEGQLCVIKADNKGNRVLKKWVVNGKRKKTNIILTDDGALRLQEWLANNIATTTN